jgi:hypothetical protein
MDERIEALKLLGQTADQIYRAVAMLPRAAKRGKDSAAELVALLLATYRPMLEDSLHVAGCWLGANSVEVPTPLGRYQSRSACEGARELLSQLQSMLGKWPRAAAVIDDEAKLAAALKAAWKRGKPKWLTLLTDATANELRQIAIVATNETNAAIRSLGGGAVYLGDGLIEVDGKPYRIEQAHQFVVEALVKLKAATAEQLARASGVEDAVKVLRAVCDAIPELKPHITLPGGRGKGGYRTTIEAAEVSP